MDSRGTYRFESLANVHASPIFHAAAPHALDLARVTGALALLEDSCRIMNWSRLATSSAIFGSGCLSPHLRKVWAMNSSGCPADLAEAEDRKIQCRLTVSGGFQTVPECLKERTLERFKATHLFDVVPLWPFEHLFVYMAGDLAQVAF